MMIPIPTDPEAQREIVKAARDYADSLLKSPLKEFGGLLADSIGHWRQMNQVRFLFKAKKYMEEKGVEPKKLLPDVFVPLIEEAGNTSDEALSEVFARLAAAHLDEKDEQNVHPSYTKIAGQLAPLDFKIMQIIDAFERSEWEQRGKPGALYRKNTPEDMLKELTSQGHNVTLEKVERSLENLDRLQLLRGYMPDTDPRILAQIKLTSLGGRLFEAGSDPKSRWRSHRRPIPEESPLDQLKGEIAELKRNQMQLRVAGASFR
jgi:hypothetical protein